MPIQQEHLDKAAHNERFLGTFDINSTPYTDWMVTVAFYIAVQYIDAYLASKGYEGIPNHKTRNSLITLAMIPRAIQDQYFQLKDDSENARYEAYQFTPQKVNEVLNNFLEPIRCYIQQVLGLA